MKTISISSKQKNYDIIIKDNLLEKMGDYLDVNKFYIIIADDQIPSQYINLVKKTCIK